MAGAQTAFDQPKNLICNMRAPDLPHFSRWKTWTQWCQDNGLDICHVTLSLTDAFMKGPEATATIRNGQQIIHIKMENQFLYAVQKPRREPYDLSSVKSEFRRTFSSILFEAYVLEKARQISQEFCYRDFLELKQDAFHRIVRRLKRKGKLIANPQRTVPRFYILTERLGDQETHARQTQ